MTSADWAVVAITLAVLSMAHFWIGEWWDDRD